MISKGISRWLAATVICLLFLAAGCASVTGEGITLALRFTPEDSTAYRVITNAEDRVQFEGSLLKKSSFRDKRNQTRIEMTFTQQIQSTDKKGNATAKITIKELKYLSIYQNNPLLDFDSSKEKMLRNPLAKLIGQSYTIKIAPTGKVIEVVDVKQAQAAITGRSSAEKEALKLLSPNVIKQRHTITALPVTGKNELSIGDNWRDIKAFDFRLMGTKSYEKIYTLDDIDDIDGRQIAIVDMYAIPSSEMAEELHKEQTASSLLRMFDTTEEYTGELTFDLTAGKVEKYFERLRSDWVVAEPLDTKEGKEEEESKPGVIRMRAIRSYSFTKID